MSWSSYLQLPSQNYIPLIDRHNFEIIMAPVWLVVAVLGFVLSSVFTPTNGQKFGSPPPLPTKGVRLYQGLQNRVIPNYAMLAYRDFADADANDDGLSDGLWCQSSLNIFGIGRWELPSAETVSGIPGTERVYMAYATGQVGLLPTGNLGPIPFQGMYTCTIPESGVNQILVVWAAGNGAYDSAPDPVAMGLSFIPSTKPRDTDPPELILSFNVKVAPPTYVTCQVGSAPVDVAVLSRDVTDGIYHGETPRYPVTNVTVTLRTRQAGNYQCTVSVYRASGSNLNDSTTSSLTISVTGTPTNVANVRTGNRRVELSWSAPAGSTPAVAGYEVFYGVSGSDVTWTGGTTTANTTTISVTLPIPSGKYDFFVVAFSDADNTLPSAHSTVTTIDLNPPTGTSPPASSSSSAPAIAGLTVHVAVLLVIITVKTVACN